MKSFKPGQKAYVTWFNWDDPEDYCIENFIIIRIDACKKLVFLKNQFGNEEQYCIDFIFHTKKEAKADLKREKIKYWTKQVNEGIKKLKKLEATT